MENIKFLVSSSQVNLATALEGKTSATVEAEYGDLVVEGSVLTLAHHGPRSGNSCPCLVENRPQGEQSIEVVGLSHMDLDTIGGCAALLGLKPDAPGFGSSRRLLTSVGLISWLRLARRMRMFAVWRRIGRGRKRTAFSLRGTARWLTPPMSS